MVNKLAQEHAESDEILALGRMVSYARQQAEALGLDFPTYCLEISLRAIVQEMVKAGFSPAANENAISAVETG